MGDFLNHMPVRPNVHPQRMHLLDRLIDEVGEDEDHPLASMMEVLGVLIEKYEGERVPKPA
jgi:HTH-type transcriptional regulator/antitoxin HigA